MRIRRGPATVTGVKPSARARRRARATGPRTRAGKARKRAARKPGDLPPAITHERPRGRGGSCPIVCSGLLAGASPSSCCPRSRPRRTATPRRRCGSSATPSALDTTRRRHDRRRRAGDCAGTTARPRRSTRRSTATGTGMAFIVDDPRRDARVRRDSDYWSFWINDTYSQAGHLRRTSVQPGDRILMFVAARRRDRSPATIFPLDARRRAGERRRRAAVHASRSTSSAPTARRRRRRRSPARRSPAAARSPRHGRRRPRDDHARAAGAATLCADARRQRRVRPRP